MKYRYLKQLTALCVLAALSMTGCNSSNTDTTSEHTIEVEKEKEAIEYTMDVVRRGDVSNTVTINCNYMQIEDEDISYGMDNEIISKVYVEKGDSVKKGDLLVELKTDSLEEQIDQLNFDIEYQKLLLKQTMELEQFELEARKERYKATISQLTENSQIAAEKESLTDDLDSIAESYRTTIEDYQDTISIDEYKLDSYQQKIQDSKLYAGMDGTISYVEDNLENSLTTADDTIITIIDSSICAFTSTDTEYMDYFKEGDAVNISVGYGGKQEEKEAYPMNLSDWEDEMYFQLAENDYELTIGTRGTIDIILETATDVLYLSKNAIHKADDKSYVYVVDDEGMRNIQYVETGLSGSDTVEIKSGLAEGDYVVLK